MSIDQGGREDFPVSVVDIKDPYILWLNLLAFRKDKMYLFDGEAMQIQLREKVTLEALTNRNTGLQDREDCAV